MSVLRSNRHIEYYVSLFAILAFGLLFVIVASPNKELQMFIVLLTTFFYVIFGILHHFLHHNLNRKIVIEYVIIGGFGLSVVLFLLKGGLGL